MVLPALGYQQPNNFELINVQFFQCSHHLKILVNVQPNLLQQLELSPNLNGGLVLGFAVKGALGNNQLRFLNQQVSRYLTLLLKVVGLDSLSWEIKLFDHSELGNDEPGEGLPVSLDQHFDQLQQRHFIDKIVLHKKAEDLPDEIVVSRVLIVVDELYKGIGVVLDNKFHDAEVEEIGLRRIQKHVGDELLVPLVDVGDQGEDPLVNDRDSLDHLVLVDLLGDLVEQLHEGLPVLLPIVLEKVEVYLYFDRYGQFLREKLMVQIKLENKGQKDNAAIAFVLFELFYQFHLHIWLGAEKLSSLHPNHE